MASGKSLQVEVVSHEARLWHGAALSVQISSVDGSLGILPGRQPLLAQLGEGTITVTCPGGVVSFEVNGGFASVDSDFVTLVVDSATVAAQ